MEDASDDRARCREQRIVLAISAVVADWPILCQILMAGAMQLHPGAFPLGDRTLTDPRFWSVQIVLLCVAVVGNAAVDWIRAMRETGRHPGRSLSYFLVVVLLFMFVSIMFSVSLLDGRIGWPWLAGMAVLAFLDLVFAWLLQFASIERDVQFVVPAGRRVGCFPGRWQLLVEPCCSPS